MRRSVDRPSSMHAAPSQLSLAEGKKKKRGGLFSRFAASVSSLGAPGSRDAAAQTSPAPSLGAPGSRDAAAQTSPPLAHKHTQTARDRNGETPPAQRTDSPKSVHFEVPGPPEVTPEIEEGPTETPDLDGLEELLRNLDILAGTRAVGAPTCAQEENALDSPVETSPFKGAVMGDDVESGKDEFEFHPPPSQQRTRSSNRPAEGGAVLLEERVTEAGDGTVVRERVFGLPVREVEREEVRTAHFRPAPPKYEGIGPTDREGLPLAPRQMVKKENMHDWYKAMYKTLHPTDASTDTQVVEYSSSPEPEKRRAENKEQPERSSRPTAHDTLPATSHLRHQIGHCESREELLLQAEVLFSFRAAHENELSLSKGAIVSICRRIDANWFEGTLLGRRGIFPANHVQVLSPDRTVCGRDFTAPLEFSGKKVREERTGLIEPLMCVALFSYSPSQPDELELRAGDRVCAVERCGDGWCAGASARTGRFGLFPGNYVEQEI